MRRALLLGRAARYSDADKLALDQAVVSAVGRPDLTIVTNMDFGHTDPQLVLPLGVRAALDGEARTFALVESWLR